MATLSEAARTGRNFHRKSDPAIWYYLRGKHILMKGMDASGNAMDQGWQPDAEQLVSLDWEAEPKKISISKEDLLDVAKALNDNPIVHQRRFAPVDFMKLVIEQLGLEG